MMKSWIPCAVSLILLGACRAEVPARADSSSPATAIESQTPATPPPDTISYSSDTVATLLSMRDRIEKSAPALVMTEQRYRRQPSEPADLIVYSDEHGPRKIVRRRCATTASWCTVEVYYYAHDSVLVVTDSMETLATPTAAASRTGGQDFLFVGERVLGTLQGGSLNRFTLPNQQEIANTLRLEAMGVRRHVIMLAPRAVAPPVEGSTRYVRPVDFADMPQSVRQTLDQRGCAIPQEHPGEPHNAFAGSFTGAGTAEWAVLCSVRYVSAILILDAATGVVRDSTDRSADESWVQGAGEGRWEYSRHITLRPLADIRAWRTDTKGDSIPQPIDHDAISQAFSGKYSEAIYRGQGRWFRVLTGD